jgi:UDP-glucose 4-epimerase
MAIDQMSARRRVVITGAAGFVGSHLIRRFLRDGWDVLAIVRPGTSALPGAGDVQIAQRDLERTTSLTDVLRAGDTVIHLAGRAHVMHDRASDPLAAFRSSNVVPTAMLCRSAAEVGVSRLVFVSSAKVFGEGRAEPYSPQDALAPSDPYARSKAEAEQAVRDEGSVGGLHWTIVRPPFVYGPGGKGNFPRLVSLARVATRVPLPLESIQNRRSIVFVGNLVDLIHHASQHGAAHELILLPTDARDVSTPELLRAIALASGSRARLFACPPGLLRAGASLIGRSGEMARLTESLRLDSTHLRTELGWHPPFSLESALALSLQHSSSTTAEPAHA